MDPETKECFVNKTLDGQLYDIYLAAQSGGGGGGAPTNASYVVMSNDPTLTDERVLTQGTNIAITDGGANNPVTVATVLDPTFDSVQIDTTPSAPVTPAVGKIAWNDTDGTLEFGLKGGNVDLQIGQENILLVKNDQGAPLAKGEVVYISGGNGTNLLVKKAQANSDTTSASTIGLVAEPLAINGQGFITTFGVIKNVNTNAFNDGDILYLSPTTPGAVTNVKPSAPDHLVLVGFVQKKSAGAGEIFVEIQNGYELEELHNVQINSGTLANNDLLAYNSATLTWQNKTAASSGLVTSVGATAPITSSGGATPNISTSIATNKVVGRHTPGTGVMEELTPVGITVSAGNITGIGGTVGTVDNAVPRADGTGGYTVQGSDIVIDDATTSTANNVAITNQHAGQTNSSLVLTPKGTGALIAQKPNGATSGGNARGNNAVDWQFSRSNANQVASGNNSVICGGINNRASSDASAVCGGSTNSSLALRAFIGGGSGNSTGSGYSGQNGAICAGGSNSNTANGAAFIGAGNRNSVSANASVICGGGAGGGNTGNAATATNSAILGGDGGRADRLGMQAHASGQFANAYPFPGGVGDAQRARFVLRCKTTTNSAVEMALDGSTTYLTIPAGKVMYMNIKVVGSKSDGSAVATYERQYAVKHITATGTSSEIYAPITIGSDNAAGTSLEVAVVDAGDYVRIRPTGIASETWRWVASVDAVEVAYGT